MNPAFKILVDTVYNPETRHLYGIKSVTYDDPFVNGIEPGNIIRCIITFENGYKIQGYDSGSVVYVPDTDTYKQSRVPSESIALINTIDAARMLFDYLQRQVELTELEKLASS